MISHLQFLKLWFFVISRNNRKRLPLHCSAIFFYTQGMLTLHQATDEIKTVAKIGTIVVVIIFLIFFLWKGIGIMQNIINPPPPPPPNTIYGKLPLLTFPESEVKTSFTYRIDTISGELPSFPDRIAVFPIEQEEPNLLALERAQERVEQLGFFNPGVPISPSLYQWTDPTDPNRILKYDIVSLNFSLTSPLSTNAALLSGRYLPAAEEAKQEAIGFISSLTTFPQDIDSRKTTIELFSLINGTIVPATSFANAQLTRVDFFQQSIFDLPVFYPKAATSTMQVTIGSGDFEPKVLFADFFYQKYSSPSATTEIATYPVKTTQEAYDELQKGNAYIISGPQETTTIAIKDVKLGYYFDSKPQQYLTPIFVFEGEQGFTAYVSAVKREWFE